MTAGLVAYRGTAPEQINFSAAAAAAHWRGAVQRPVAIDGVGFICAQGRAECGLRGHLAVGFHGRIDNFSDLSRGLAMPCEDELDLLAALYQKHGDDFATKILGEFAIVLLDAERKCLLASRDWVGTRPLFWLEHQAQMAVTSEIKQALCLFGLPMVAATEPLAAFAADEPIDPEATFVQGVHAVPAFGYLKSAQTGPARTWRKQVRFQPVHASAEEVSKEIRRRLETAIIRRIASDTRTGAMMSGGVDSTTATSVAAALAQSGRIPALECCYTMALPEVPQCDETAQARRAAEAIGIPWKPVVIRIDDYKAWPERAFDLHDGPVFPTACGASMIIRQASKDGIDTLLTGLGGDEFTDQAGVEFRQCVLGGEWGAALRWVRSGQPARLKSVLGATARAARDYLLNGVRAETKFEETASRFWTRYTLELIEREGARCGIEIASPFFDSELASYLAGVAPAIRSTPALSKAILREVAAGLLPDAVRLDPRIIIYNAVVEAAVGPIPPGEPRHQFIGRCYAQGWLERTHLMLK